ncbi:MAG: elongation factor Ts [Hyphomicrobiaceae bacterium]|nr:elongation factor Ts [Hyphomicrobiaceae bacterium]
MTTITATMVKELRERTGAGMMDCKSALTETGGDIEAAIDWLRTKGLAKAAKKAGRVAAEGLVGVVTTGKTGAMVEVNSETDFVARNEQFQGLVSTIAKLAPEAGGDVSKLLATSYPDRKETVEEYLKEMVATIGENMSLRRTAAISVKDGVVGSYVHNQVADGLGKIGVLVGLEAEGGKADVLAELGRQIAMHVAATNPIALNIDLVPADVLEREKGILAEKNQGKKPEVLEKIFQSSLKSFAKEYCLLDQPFIHDSSKSVAQALKDVEKAAGAAVTIVGYVRYALGEGIEKAEDDFAAEVAAAAGTK